MTDRQDSPERLRTVSRLGECGQPASLEEESEGGGFCGEESRVGPWRALHTELVSRHFILGVAGNHGRESKNTFQVKWQDLGLMG